MIFKSTLLPAICLDEEHAAKYPDECGLELRKGYLLLGQVSVLENGFQEGIHHYILMNITTGTIIPGMWHSDRFRYITNEDDFF